mmetsp:Transcript_18802/g.34123  ORF Transcript_18802/g.34123 Transcript_18802/m.34123 type:complete len:205 (-) Transcript_18802:221-835(-)
MQHLPFLTRPLLAMSLILAGLSWIATVHADSGWMQGRATWYDMGNLKDGNCHFDWSPTGRFVAAWPDKQWGFASSCGRCYEVRCRNSDFRDGYGQFLDRSQSCYDSQGKSVVLTITDACPCSYPNNAYSNQRWCCGDMNHMDLSKEAFEQLANLDVGVIGMEFREVDCYSKGNQGGDGNKGSNGGGYWNNFGQWVSSWTSGWNH